MLWCISTSPFDLAPPTRKKQRISRPIKISAPIPRPSGSMHLRSSSAVENTHGNTRVDTGALHLVPNKSAGKTIVRKRVPPPAISPTLDEMGSATPTATSSKAAEMASANGRRPTLAIRTAAPLADLNDGSTARTTTPKPRFDPMKAFRNSFRGRQTENDIPSMNGHRWKGKEKAIVFDEEEADETRESKVVSKAREIREWMKGKSGSDIHRSATYAGNRQDKAETSYATRTRQTVGGVRDLFKNRRPVPDRGPKPGQTYEIVNRRIIENNSEKTVEISTWREHATKEAKPEDVEDRMSIYYVNADEYPQEGDYPNEVSPTVEWRIEGSEMSRIDRANSKAGAISNRYPNVRGVDLPQVEKRKLGRSNSRQQAENGRAVNSPLKRDGTISPSTSEKDPESSSLTNGPPVGGSKLVEGGIPASSTPVEKHTPRISRHRGRYTHIEKELPRSPFHPTQSGSTISSIKSESTIKFEAILESCEPSLLHVAPILRSLGIRRVEHLKAVARLSPNTRDREVKEDALRLGITVMEWAILVDKIFML